MVYVGSKTGRDGIHGATMASAEFDEASAEKRPTVQVGDPFTEKLLLEACLELMQEDAIVAIQDMGAAGLTSSSVEMADKGGVGIELDLDQVPTRETGMTAYEMMLSESQERMLMVLKPGAESDGRARISANGSSISRWWGAPRTPASSWCAMAGGPGRYSAFGACARGAASMSAPGRRVPSPRASRRRTCRRRTACSARWRR